MQSRVVHSCSLSSVDRVALRRSPATIARWTRRSFPAATACPAAVNCMSIQERYERSAQRVRPAAETAETTSQLEEAFARFDEASRLVPQDPQFLSARELTKSQLVFQHTERGDAFLENGQREPAAAEFRAALNLDPDNALPAGAPGARRCSNPSAAKL